MSDLQLPAAEAYRSLVEHAPYGIFRTTRSGRVLMANPAFVHLLGYETEDDVLDLDLDEDVYVDGGERERIIEEPAPGPYEGVEARWKRADGEEIIVRLSGRPVFADDGAFLFFETFVEDVTEEHRAKRRLNRVLKSSGSLLFSLEPVPEGFRTTWVSEGVRKVLGYTIEEASREGWFPDGLHPEDRGRALSTATAVLEKRHVVQEFRFQHRDGGYRWFQQELRLLEGVPRVGSEIVGVWVDITDRKEAEQALRESKDHLDRVLEASGAFIFILVPDGDRLSFAWLSDGVRTLLGYPRREAMQPGWFLTGIHPQDRDEARMQALSALEGEDVVLEFRFRHRNGGYRWLREDLRSLEVGPDGSAASLVGVAVDITEQKETERAFREGAERLRTIMNAVPDAVLTVDSQGRIVDLNPAVETVYGYRAEELVGRPFTVLFPARFREESSRNFDRLISNEGEKSFQGRPMRGLHRSGREFSAELSVAQHRMDGAPYVTAVFRDVTERRRMEAERTELIEELQTALREVRTLRGILPMCANCKKVRDEGGHWERVETYIRSHSEAELSHGICPECAQELYGENLWDDGEE